MVVWGDGMNYLICRAKKRWFGGGPGSLFAELRAHQGTPFSLKGPQKGGSGMTGLFQHHRYGVIELRGHLIGVHVKPCARSSSAPRNNLWRKISGVFLPLARLPLQQVPRRLRI